MLRNIAPRRNAGEGLRLRIGKVARDERATRRRRFDPAFRREFLKRSQDRVSMHAERSRESATAGQRIAGAEAAASNVCGNGVCDLDEERLLHSQINRKRQLPARHLVCHISQIWYFLKDQFFAIV